MCQMCNGLGEVLPSRIELERTIALVEQELIAEGVPPLARPLRAVMRVADKLNLKRDVPLTHGPVADPVIQYFDARYTRSQLAMPFPYVGAFLFRGSLYEVRVPIIFGTDVPVDPFCVFRDLPVARKQELEQSTDLGIFVDQFVDIMDFGQGNLDLPCAGLHSEALELLQAAKSHAESAAAASRGNDGEAAMHSVFLASEVILKGALRARGLTLSDLKRIGHNLPGLVQEAVIQCPNLDLVTLGRALALIPQDVATRYQFKGYGIQQVGRAIMAVQFIGGEIMRQLTTRNARVRLRCGGQPTQSLRVFP